MELHESPCLCKAGNDRVLFPQKIDWSRFSAYEFSARRRRRIQHYRIVRCNGCGLVRFDPVLADRDLAALYRESQFLYPQESVSAARSYASLVAPYVALFPQPEQVRLLEIGCGNGTFLEAMRRLQLGSVTGIEPSTRAVEQAADGIRPSIIGDLFRPGLLPPESFDLVCAFHILDHVADPAGFMKECLRILRHQGLLIIVCHHVDAWMHRLLGEYSPVFDIEHLFLFNPVTLRRLAESCGFVSQREGRMRNTYPLAYWCRYVPVANRLAERLPPAMQRIPLTLYAGNIYLCARKG